MEPETKYAKYIRMRASNKILRDYLNRISGRDWISTIAKASECHVFYCYCPEEVKAELGKWLSAAIRSMGPIINKTILEKIDANESAARQEAIAEARTVIDDVNKKDVVCPVCKRDIV